MGGCRTNSSDSDANPCSSTTLPSAARNGPRSMEMTSEIDDPSVETDSCDSLVGGGYRVTPTGTSGIPLTATRARRTCSSLVGGSGAIQGLVRHAWEQGSRRSNGHPTLQLRNEMGREDPAVDQICDDDDTDDGQGG